MNYYNIWKLKENEKVCALDLDDVLANSIPFWIKYVNKNLKTNFRDLNRVKNTVPYNVYRNLKIGYRVSGVKLQIPPMKHASKLTLELKKRGYEIVIMTARPMRRHKCLFRDTIIWLLKNKICFDAIIWGEDKYVRAMTDVENLKFLIEDNRYIANKISDFGFKCYLLNNKYNQGKINKNVKRINDLLEVLKYEK